MRLALQRMAADYPQRVRLGEEGNLGHPPPSPGLWRTQERGKGGLNHPGVYAVCMGKGAAFDSARGGRRTSCVPFYLSQPE